MLSSLVFVQVEQHRLWNDVATSMGFDVPQGNRNSLREKVRHVLWIESEAPHARYLVLQRAAKEGPVPLNPAKVPQPLAGGATAELPPWLFDSPYESVAQAIASGARKPAGIRMDPPSPEPEREGQGHRGKKTPREELEGAGVQSCYLDC